MLLTLRELSIEDVSNRDWKTVGNRSFINSCQILSSNFRFSFATCNCWARASSIRLSSSTLNFHNVKNSPRSNFLNVNRARREIQLITSVLNWLKTEKISYLIKILLPKYLTNNDFSSRNRSFFFKLDKLLIVRVGFDVFYNPQNKNWLFTFLINKYLTFIATD